MSKSKHKSAAHAFKNWMHAFRLSLRGPLQRGRLRRDVRIFEAGARVEEDDSVFGLQVARSKKVIVGDRGCRAFRRKKNPFVFRPIF